MINFKETTGPNRVEIDKEVKSITSKKKSLGVTRASYDTTKLDPFRQGVHIRNQIDRFAGFQVKFSEGSDDHVVSTKQFGQPKLFNDEHPFNDLPEYSRPSIIGGVAFGGSVAFMEDGRSTVDLYPQLRFNQSMEDPATMDGVIEPFQVRETITNTSIESPFYSRCIRASLSGGDTNRMFGTSPLTNKKIDYSKRSDSLETFVPDYYEDSQDYMFKIGNISLPFPGYISEDSRKDTPFDDSFDILEKDDLFKELTHEVVSGSIRAKINSEDENVFYSCGRDYYNNNNIVISNGTDSIAFGGLIK